MQVYLSENVGRQAAMMSRKQEQQLIGDTSRVLVGRQRITFLLCIAFENRVIDIDLRKLFE